MSGLKGVGAIAGQFLNTVGAQTGTSDKTGSGANLRGKRTSNLSAASGLPRADITRLSKGNQGILANAGKQMMEGTVMNAAMTNMGTVQNTVNGQIQNQGKMAMATQDQVNNWIETISASIAKGGKKAQG
jgi:hypothetical protein